MPKLPIDYSKTVIYCIKCKDDNITEEYIGSTTDFIKRKYQHKTSCNNEKSKEYNQLKYKIIRENGGWDNWIMIELEKYSCNDKRESEKREEDIRIERKASLNMKKAFTTEEQIKEYLKEYREQNKGKIKEYNKEYKKKYYEENKEKINEYNKEYQKEYYEENKKKEYICSCGWIGTNNSKYYHFKKCNPIV